jgi:trehalose 6-phosphate phosphatase
MAQPADDDLPSPVLPLDRKQTALFFDFDGTLAPIVADPHTVRLPPRTVDLLARLSALTEGALAVVSGRPVAELDLLLKPLVLPVGGVHGRQRRDSAGRLFDAATDGSAVRAADAPLAAFAMRHAGTLIERKPGAVALHYRRRPELAAGALALARGIAQMEPALRLIEGKMVVEFCVGRIGKGDAVAAFMAEPPFAGRRPLFFGDDVTDEDAYPVVDGAGGLSVRIGPGATRARHRLPDVEALQDWLSQLAADWAVPEP